MPAKVWIDGTLHAKNDARISVFDHGLLYGDGVWEGMRIFGGRVFKLREHLGRLYTSADSIALRVPLSPDELADAVTDTVRANDRTEGYVRLTVTRGTGTLGLDPRKCDPTVIVVAEDVMPYPREVVEAGLEVVALEAAPARPVKTLSYLAHVAAKAEALRAGCLDAVLLNPLGQSVGTTAGNLFVVRGGTLLTHPLDAGVFPGITRGVVLELARGLGLPVAEEATPGPALATADELFLTGTDAGVVGIVKVGGRAVGSGQVGPITRRLRAAYGDAVRA